MVDKLKPYLKGLNKGQAEVLAQMVDFVLTGEEHGFLVKGYAGTGKTFMLKRFIEFMEDNYKHRNIALTAPTNKAVKIIKDSVGSREGKSIFDQGRIFGTIHSLFKLKESVNFKGERSFKSSGKLDFKFKILIVDEVSMLPDELFFVGDDLVHSQGIKIIYLGDKAQIPPVGQVDSIPLNKAEMYNIKSVELTEIMRQKKGNKLLPYYSRLRENLDKEIPIKKKKTALSNDGLEGIEFIDKEMNLEIIEKYVLDTKYIDDSTFFKILAWRNVTIDKINNRVRSLVFGDDAELRFNTGEKLIANKPIFVNPGDKNIYISTSSELTVKSVSIGVRIGYDSDSKIKTTYKSYVLTVENEKGILLDESIYVCHEDDLKLFIRDANKLKRLAIKAKSGKIWKNYYTFMNTFADVKYAYGLTVHKSQGSTYENVFLIEGDLNFNRNLVERNRIKYTGYTRCSKKLIVVS